MDLTLYKPTETEQWINKKYQENGIYYASDMDIEHIASIFNSEIRFYNGPSFAKWEDNEYSFIFLNSYSCIEQQRETFFHELPHPLLHVGSQHHLPELFTELQEAQATQFQLYAAMPIYMIHEFIHDVYSWAAFEKVLSEAFCLPIRFVQRRLNQINNRTYIAKSDKERRERKVDTSYITTEYIRQKQAEIGRQRKERERLWEIS